MKYYQTIAFFFGPINCRVPHYPSLEWRHLVRPPPHKQSYRKNRNYLITKTVLLASQNRIPKYSKQYRLEEDLLDSLQGETSGTFADNKPHLRSSHATLLHRVFAGESHR